MKNDLASIERVGYEAPEQFVSILVAEMYPGILVHHSKGLGLLCLHRTG
jgi:hypothetical protein